MLKLLLAALALVMFMFGVFDRPQVFDTPVLYDGLALLSAAILAQWLEGYRAG